LLCLEDRCLPSTLTVTTLADSGLGSLRAQAAAAAPGDTLDFDSALRGGTVTLTSGELLLGKSLTIQGLGPGLLAVSGTNNSRVLEVTAGASVVLADLTLTQGRAGGYTDHGGAAVVNAGAALALTHCTVADNSAPSSGTAPGPSTPARSRSAPAPSPATPAAGAAVPFITTARWW
jgi:hypothetical protein